MVSLKSLKFMYSEKATKFCEIFTLLLSHVVPVKSMVEILQNFVAFLENMNFKILDQISSCVFTSTQKSLELVLPVKKRKVLLHRSFKK